MLPRAGDEYIIADIDKFLNDGVIESEHLDYKADPHIFGEKDPVAKIQAMTAKAVVALANSGGGTLLLGVDEGNNGEPMPTTPPGMPALLGKENIAERIDRMITGSTKPRAPATVSRVLIPNTDRAYVIVDIAPRGGGPYRVIGTKDNALDDRYFVRLGRSSMISDHYQLQQLFAQSAASIRDVREYLERRRFGDPESPDFGKRAPAGLLIGDSSQPEPTAAFFTAIPEVLRGQIIDTNGERLRKRLQSGSTRTDFGESEVPTSEGRAIETLVGGYLYAYLHIHRTGYFEAGHKALVQTHNGSPILMADAIQRLLPSFLGVVAQTLSDAGVLDHVLVGVHVREARMLKLGRYSQFNVPSGRGQCRERNLSVNVSAPVNELLADSLRVQIDHRLSEAYGEDDGTMFLSDGRPKAPSFHVG